MAATRTRVPARLAPALGVAAVVEVGVGIALTIAVGWSWHEAVDAFVASNAVIGASFALCGALITWHRPNHVVGWLFVADGLGHATTALAVPLAQALHDGGAPRWAERLAVTAFAWSWPWSIGLFLPLALLLFPDGRLPSPRWRGVAIAVAGTATLFAVEVGTDPTPPLTGMAPGLLTLSSYDAWKPLWTVSELRTSLALIVAVVALAVRYRRGSEAERRQLLWLLLAAVVVVALVLPWSFVAGTPIAVLFAIPLIPVAVTIAILRHQLLDIRLIVSRALAWVLLSIAVVAAYVLLVAVLAQFVSATFGRSAVATVVIALLVAPLLPRLQRIVDRAMYGDRGDPARVASTVGRLLGGGDEAGLGEVVAAVRRSLRLPHLALDSLAGTLVADGDPAGHVEVVPLTYGGETVGSLTVGLRAGERELAAADRDALALVAAPLAVAVHATALSSELQASRERLVAAREEERRRLRRDLHDGLGPTLTGLALAADAAANLVERDPVKATDLLASLRRDARVALTDVRRLVDDLRPPALDELGLVGALRRRAEEISLSANGSSLRVEVDADVEQPALPAAVEVATYRIVTEALNNVVRHSPASRAVVSLRCADRFEVDVVDDGPTNGGPWRPGVGLHAMRERAAELGGRCVAGPSPDGGRVHVSFPLTR